MYRHRIFVAMSAPPAPARSLELTQLPDALAESARRLIVRKVGKLRLDGLREVRVFDDGIHRLFAQKVGVELHTQRTRNQNKSRDQECEEDGGKGGVRCSYLLPIPRWA